MHLYTYVCMRVCIYIRMYVCMYVYLCIYMGRDGYGTTRVYVCMYLCIYMGRDGSGATRISAPENAEHHRITTTVHRKNGGGQDFFL